VPEGHRPVAQRRRLRVSGRAEFRSLDRSRQKTAKKAFADYGKSEKNGWRRAELRSPEAQPSEGRSGRGGGEGSGAVATDAVLKKSAGKGG